MPIDSKTLGLVRAMAVTDPYRGTKKGMSSLSVAGRKHNQELIAGDGSGHISGETKTPCLSSVYRIIFARRDVNLGLQDLGSVACNRNIITDSSSSTLSLTTQLCT